VANCASCNWVNLFGSVQFSSSAVNPPNTNGNQRQMFAILISGEGEAGGEGANVRLRSHTRATFDRVMLNWMAIAYLIIRGGLL